MAGLRGNNAWIAWAKQTGKGAVPTQASYMSPLSGGTLSPTREVNQLSETDSVRNEGQSYVSVTGSEGSPELYVRDSNIHSLLYLALGAKADTGTTPNYTHTITPALALPYVAFWRMLGNTLWQRFDDCKLSELTISADAGSPLTAAATFSGRGATRLTSDPSPSWTTPAVTLDTGPVYNYNEAIVTLAGSASASISSFELTIANNVTTQQTDDSVPYDVVEGLFSVTLGFDMIFETLDEYNRFHTGTIAGTTQANTLATVAADFTFSKGANNSIDFNLPAIAYEEFPADPDPGGAPVVSSVRARAQRGGSPFLTATVKNQVAT